MRRSIVMVAALCVVVAARVGAGQTILASDGATASTAQGGQDHAWVGVPIREDTTLLLHLPPGSGRGGVAQAGLATRLTSTPEAIAAVGREAYLCFPQERGSDQVVRRRVLAITAQRVAGVDRWEYTGGERLRVAASLKGSASLLGFEATSEGVFALLGRPSGPGLVMLEGRGWAPVELPPELRTTGTFESLRLERMGDELVLIDVVEGGEPGVWIRSGGAWRAAPAFGTYASGIERAAVITGCSDRLAWLTLEGEALSLLVSGAQARFDFGEVANASTDIALFDTGGTPSVVVLSRSRDSEGELGTIALKRISIGTGAIIDEAEVRLAGPVSGSQFVLVLVMLGGVLMMIVTFVFWPEQEQEPALPEQLMLATSSRRLVAGAIDLLLGVVPAALIVGVPIQDVVLPGLSADAMASLSAIVLALAIASVQCTVFEWAGRKSIGKALMGIEVYAEREEGLARLQLWQAAVRNVVKWWLAPAALAGLCRTWRHVGDLASGSVVVQPMDQDVDDEG